ncbi:GAF domain-containing sensor histidine kinase [Virgibacillus sp. C22-A2]|uniref:histidine kinase n=1 Tax=Virgibacillus tibetensis TaxID=3042313 RepID=A0ABU6KH37_9BACI|nr:GAF domain-containing sensor histidine kinase [Virgibacillus sp. C22-A2]
MTKKQLAQKRETYARVYMTLVSVVGSILVLYHLFQLQLPKEPVILLLFVTFIAITEYFPIPVWKGNTTLNFPIVFTLYLLYGLSYTILVYAVVVLAINIIRRRPLRIIFFNPAALIISFFSAVLFTELLTPVSFFNSEILNSFLIYGGLLISFHVINNAIIDAVLWLRPQVYSFHAWKQKTFSEGNSAFISLLYGYMLYILGSQNRGEIDFFSFFFFFSPLVGLSLLSAVISRLRREKARLKALFSITSELNTMVPAEEFLADLQTSFQDIVEVDAEVLWIKEGNEWTIRYAEGNVDTERGLSDEDHSIIETILKPTKCNDRKSDIGIARNCFDAELNSFVYAPLSVEREIVGMFIVAKSRTKSFGEEDVSSIATFANQLSIVLKTRALIQEKEKRLILEERNRIARDIHDGIAQSMAGAIMSLETAERKYRNKPEETLEILSTSIKKLRTSLIEVRESIYALRPYPTERIGLVPAMKKKINSIINELSIDIRLKIRGQEETLSSMTEKVLFDVFQESIANSIKHSKSNEIDVLLSYQSEHILLRTKDYGIGFSLFQEMIKAKDTSHFGILNMNESVEKINGSLQIDSKEGKGTEVSIIIPKMGLEGGETYDKRYVSR